MFETDEIFQWEFWFSLQNRRVFLRCSEKQRQAQVTLERGARKIYSGSSPRTWLALRVYLAFNPRSRLPLLQVNSDLKNWLKLHFLRGKMTSFFRYRDRLLRLEKLSLFLGFGFFFFTFLCFCIYLDFAFKIRCWRYRRRSWEKRKGVSESDFYLSARVPFSRISMLHDTSLLVNLLSLRETCI